MNRSLWLATLVEHVNLIVPFDDDFLMKKQPIATKYFDEFDKTKIYHRSALTSLVMNSMLTPISGQCKSQMSDTFGNTKLDLNQLIQNVLYSANPNIALPLLQLPLRSVKGDRFTKTIESEAEKMLVKDNNFIKFNHTS